MDTLIADSCASTGAATAEADAAMINGHSEITSPTPPVKNTAEADAAMINGHASRIARARDSGVDSIADECVELSDIEPADQVQAAWRRTQIDTRLKLLAKWSPKKYGDRTAVEHQGGISLTVVTGVPQPDAITGRKPDAKQIT